MPLLTPFELHLHAEGTLHESYRTMGAHEMEVDGQHGVRFAVWAPNAQYVAVVGDFNDWNRRKHPMFWRDSGIWELFVPGIAQGAHYKYVVVSHSGWEQWKCDPYGFFAEVPPRTASIVWRLDNYEWSDTEWMDKRAKRDTLHEPVAIYEVHLESWLRGPENTWLTYQELARRLVEYVGRMGYTHVEFLPVMEHPYGGSWGYQITGHYAPTSRFGTPDDFRFLVDSFHRAGIGVILDWVPAHFPRDAYSLARFDGTALYEHEDPRRGEHRDWGTLIFNFGRNEVRTFLLSNALYWIKEFHVDGFRVDAVASMLYLDYSREPGDWEPNKYGGRENIDAITFLQRFNELVHETPGVFSVAEEATSWPGVSRPVYMGGLGFTFKWNMGWMHDMFRYFKQDPVYRKHFHNNITFSLLYAFTENFVLPVSHDEVVHLKRSLVGKMPGDEWQRFANARAFLGYMYTHPGKKLLFMGQEIGQTDEWNNEFSLPWHLLNFAVHSRHQTFVRELNWFYRREPALFQVDDSYAGFEWIDFHDADASVIVFARFTPNRNEWVVVCCNFTPIPRHNYRLGVPDGGYYREILNTDAGAFGGSNMGNHGGVWAEPRESHGRPYSVAVTLPPLAVICLKR